MKWIKTIEDQQEVYCKVTDKVTNPAFKLRDDGSWSVVLQTSIGKLANE